MTKTSRTYNVLKNSSIAMICQIITILIGFISRTVFTNVLGSEYLGVNGLFSNVLTILSFAELGIGSALVFRMYKPLADDNKNKLKLYIRLYKKIYNCILIIMFVGGICVIPFIDNIVTAPMIYENIKLLYFLYLLDLVASYFFVYKKSLLIADQKDYVVSLITQSTNIVSNIIQIGILILTHNFIFYCVVKIISTVTINFLCNIYVNNHYPYIQNNVSGSLSVLEKNELKRDVKGLVLTKIASTMFSGTDNIFISAYIGIKYVGILSNYTLLIMTVNSILNKIFSSITASIGNLIVTEDNVKTEITLKRLFFINTSIYTYMCMGMYFLLTEFITDIWFSDKYFLTKNIVTIVILELYIRGLHYPIYLVRNASGRFSEYKFIFLLMAILNIGLDFILVKPLGIVGLYLATIICRGITYLCDIYVVYKIQLGKNILEYYKLFIDWIIYIAISGGINYVLLSMLNGHGLVYFSLKVATITIVYTLTFILFFWKNQEMEYFKSLLLRVRIKLMKG